MEVFAENVLALPWQTGVTFFGVVAGAITAGLVATNLTRRDPAGRACTSASTTSLLDRGAVCPGIRMAAWGSIL